MQAADLPHGRYLYGVIRCAEPRTFETPGIGAHGGVVRTLHANGIAAVVSASPIFEYEQTRRNMMAHMKVLEEVMQTSPVLPVRFGTIAPSEDAVCENVLQRHHRSFAEQLDWIEDRIEFGLKAFWPEEAAVFAEILVEHPSIRRLRDRLMGKRLEATYYDRIELGKQIEEAMQKKRAQDQERLLAALRPVLDDLKLHETLTDMMVLNAALLVEKRHEAALDEAIQDLDQTFDGQMRFKYVGPVPPYNFVSLHVHTD